MSHENASDFTQYLDGIQGSTKDWQQLYCRRAETYDEEKVKFGYTGPKRVAQIVGDQIKPERYGNVRILDVGAGTGLVARELQKIGFQHIDALEPCEDMLNIAKNESLYEHYFVEFINGTPSSLDADTYDVVTASGIFVNESHVPCEALYEMIRIVKPGGYIILNARHHLLQDVKTLRDLEPLMDKLVADGKWKKLSSETWPGYFDGIDGIVWCFQKQLLTI